MAGGGARLACAQDAPDEPTGPPDLDEPLPLWEIGAFAIGGYQPAYPGSDQNLARARLLPYAIYRGSILRLEGGSVGVRALRTPRYEWDVSATGSFGASANQVRVRAGMAGIGTLVEIGPAWRINLGDLIDPRRDARLTRLELPIRAVFDANDRLAHRGRTFEPRLSHTAWRGASAALVFSASALFGDRLLNHLFYGVDPAYVTADRPAYAAKGGLIALRLGASLRQRVSSAVRLQWFTQVETVRGAANESSPLVRSRQEAGFGASLTWGIWQSTQTGVE